MKNTIFVSSAVIVVLGIAVSGKTIWDNSTTPGRETASQKATINKIPNLRLHTLETTQKFILKNNLDQVEYSGILIKEDADFYKSSQHLERYYIDNDGERIEFEPVNKDAISGLTGQEVTLTGWSDRHSDKTTGFVLAQDNHQAAKPDTNQNQIRHEKMLVVMGDFYDSTPLPTGPNAVNFENIGPFLNSGTFQEYFNFIYQRRIKNTITKVVNYRFRRNCADKALPGRPEVPGYIDTDDLKLLFTELNLNPRDFTNVSVLANCNSSIAWGIGSASVVDGVFLTTSNLTLHPIYYIYGSPDGHVPYLPNPDDGWTFLDAFIHERLHTFGLPHSNGLDCGTNQLLFPCIHREYQNPFDVMGSRNPGYQVSAHLMRNYKIRPESQFLTITKPGTYTIEALESTNAKALIAAYIKIPEIDESVFMVEHRVPMGYDRNLIKPKYGQVPKGLLLYSSISPGYEASYSKYGFRIVDPYPDSVTDLDIPFLERIKNKSVVAEKPYFDPITGVKITVVSKTASKNVIIQNTIKRPSITFKVDFDNKNRICFKAKLENLIEPFNFIINSIPFRSDEIVILRPGDIFNIQATIHQYESAVCPKILFQTTIFNTELITSWTLPKGSEGGTTKGSGDGLNTGSAAGGGHNPSQPTIENAFNNYDIVLLVNSNMKVPTNAQSGYYELPVSYTNPTSGESFNSLLKFKIVNDYLKAAPVKKIR